MTTSRRTVLAAALASALTTALVGGATLVYANHQFPDVATSSAFHESVGNFVDAGCATGFPSTGLPCDVLASLDSSGESATLSNPQGGTVVSGQFFEAATTLVGLLAVDAGATVTVGMTARVDNGCAASVVGTGEVSLLSVPFAGDGSGGGEP